MLKVESKDKMEWVPTELNFGVPLGEIALNQTVCDKIIKHQLFSEENLELLSKNSRELNLKLLEFISQHKSPEQLADSDAIPYPNKDIQFSNGVLSTHK